MSRRRIENCRDKQGFIDLNKLKNYREKGAVVEGSNAKTWFNVMGTRVLFKEYDSILPCFGEVLYYKASKMCDVDCAEYQFATFEGKKGAISYNFLKENEAYYNFLELTTQFRDSHFDFESVASNYDLLVIQNNKYNNLHAIKELLDELFRISNEERNNIEINLIKMFCLDTLFWHKDRTLWNHGVAINEETDEVRFAPIHDNGYVLCLNKGEQYIEDCIVEFINCGVMNSSSKYSSFDVLFEEDDSIEQLINFYSCCDEDERKIIEDVVRKLDVENVVKDTCEECKIGDVPSLWVKAVLNFRKKTILRGLESVKINDDEARLPSVAFSKRK